MPKTKQTARKTTGKHLTLAAHHSRLPAPSGPKSKPRRAQHRPPATSGTSSSRSPTKSILTRPNVVLSDPPSPDPVSHPPSTSLSPSSLDVPLWAGLPSSSARLGTTFTSGVLIRRRPVEGLDMPISICVRFATWLETQKCVHDETLLRAVERDGSHFLSLAKSAVMFDNALRGHCVPVPPATNSVVSPLGEHARTLRVFAELLKSKNSEGSLSDELGTAVLRDGEALLRLAICCLEFDQAIRGPDSTQVK